MTSHAEALARLTAPGAPFEMVDLRRSDGTVEQVFVQAPGSLREFFAQARTAGDATALVYGDERLSFRELFAGADAFAVALVERYGIRPGDRVAVAMRNCPEWVMSFIAITSVGGICVSLNSWWTGGELAYGIEDSAPSLLIADQPRAELIGELTATRGIPVVIVRGSAAQEHFSTWTDVLRPGPLPAVDIAPDDDATLLYTSGTTGRPKGAVSTHRAVIHAVWGAAAMETVDALMLGDAEPAEPPAALLGIPLFHVTGCVSVMLGALNSGMKLVVMRRWDPEEALRMIESERLSVFIGVPTQTFDLVNHPRFDEFDTSSLRWIGGGGATTPPALLTQIREQFDRAAPAFGYGMTETNALGPAISGDEAHAFPESTGRVAPPMQVAIHDPTTLEPLPVGDRGEIWLRGPSLFRGYWNRPDATAATLHEGWLRTGDIGHLDADGRVFIDDRLKDMIVRGGENVYSAEVEAALYEHPDVLEAAVCGIPHRRLGEQVAAVIVVRPGSTLDQDGLVAFVSPHLAAFKIPSVIEIRTEGLPRNPSGKFIKTELRAQLRST
ncbi:hypothetical protein BHE97_04700 [Aeromicrobium sp. PE09-221]|uniref:class I adenylate-forming enzyme family protein n=1 Tax=Aeromicrobium sp. PE09-221 TaxID=1898043 RepID=UPI000B73A1DC|nr:class I adenylate-forming enzyme family protein [Aeromicrobium sp. PE09-221]OUZ11372.1 hypothetical protein BHE97_04700 [Aeromicrobium sp. PE09-221]